MPAAISSLNFPTPLLRIGILSVFLAANGTHLCRAQEDSLPLPRWSEDPVQSESGLGIQFNDLLPPDNNLLPPPPEMKGLVESGSRLTDSPTSLMPGYSDLSPHDLSLFLHGSVQGADSERKPTAAVALRDLPYDVLLQAYGSGEREFLIDPQLLVPEVSRMDVERLLEFHGSDARIRLYLLVIDADQKLPEGAHLDSIAHEALTKADACLAIYPLGEPWRARFLVSESVHRSVPVQALTELAEDCTHDALRAADPAQQLQRFAIRLSTRLFWLEKHLPAAIAHLPAAPLQEVAVITNAVSAPLPQRRSPWLAFSFGIGTVAVLGGSPALFLVVRGRRRQRHQLSHVWMLPDLDVPTRLGGNFSGGTSAAIDYRPRRRGFS